MWYMYYVKEIFDEVNLRPGPKQCSLTVLQAHHLDY